MPASNPSIQTKIDIEDIKDGTIILKNKALRAILMTSSVNFALKSVEEQDAITYRYQEFLNSLDFPIQILITSRKFDISDYLAMLEQKKREQENELLRIQTEEYIEYVKSLTELTNIMAESFYIVIPYVSLEKKDIEQNITSKFSAILSTKSSTPQADTETFEQKKSQLWQRVEFISSALSATGIRIVPLNSEELIELFYKLYNPEAKEKPTLETTSTNSATKIGNPTQIK